MKTMNIGLANLIVSTTLKEAYFNDSLIVETKKNTSGFLDVVKNSPILQLEFKVFENIQNKHIDNETLAMRYVDDNIKLFEVYTLKELVEEHAKLKPFINENVEINENDEVLKLCNSIWSLIEESLKSSENVNVDIIHESFDYVLNHLKTPKNKNKENAPQEINEEVVEIAINNFNEKYENMTLEELKLFRKLTKSNDNEKKELFEEYKEKSLSILASLNTDNKNDKIGKSIQKINEMVFNVEKADSDIISLYELKKGLQ